MSTPDHAPRWTHVLHVRAAMGHGDDRENTASLLAKVRAGDEEATTQLAVRYLGLLRRWAHGRIPPRARRMADTSDIVQTTLLNALDGVKKFEPRREGAFLAYVRTILLNEIRDLLRQVDRRPLIVPLPSDVDVKDHRPSPLAEAIGAQALESYEAAVASLTKEQRQAVVLRVEMDFTYPQVAEAMGSPSPDAARMLIARALVRLSEIMNERAG